jgi:hypothetical protein
MEDVSEENIATRDNGSKARDGKVRAASSLKTAGGNSLWWHQSIATAGDWRVSLRMNIWELVLVVRKG